MIDPVVIILPAFNAESTLGPVVKGLRQVLPNARIIGVNDGSADGTGALLRSVCDRTIEFSENRGKGEALRVAFKAALETDCRAVLTIDSDGQHDPAFAPSILEARFSSGLVCLTPTIVPPVMNVASPSTMMKTWLVFS